MTASQSYDAAARAPRFLSLPLEVRRAIYVYVLDVSEYVCIFRDPGCRVESFLPGKPRRWLSLLYVNRQVSNEAKVVVYGSNKFLMSEVEGSASSDEAKNKQRLVESFLENIGRDNASLIRFMCVHFPAVERVGVGGSSPDSGEGELRLAGESVRQLEVLAQCCPGLRTLESLVYGGRHVSLMSLLQQDESRKTWSVLCVLGEVNALMRKVGKLKEIIIRVYGSISNVAVVDYMASLRWKVVFGGV